MYLFIFYEKVYAYAIKYAYLCGNNLAYSRASKQAQKKNHLITEMAFLSLKLNYFFLPMKSTAAGRIARAPPTMAKMPAAI